MSDAPVSVETIDAAGTVLFTVACGDCGGLMRLTIANVGPLTRSVALSLFSSVKDRRNASGAQLSATARCGRCDRNASLAEARG